ncbi:MAG: carbonic anhydrase [Acidobacteriota bacterium]
MDTPDAGPIYRTSLPWNPERPETTIITCVDGRWYQQFQEFARVHLGAGARTDFLAVPGGIEPLTLGDRVPNDFDFFRRRIEALVEAHGTRRFVAIAHEDCAWYKAQPAGLGAGDARARQIDDLRRSAVLLREMFTGVTTETYYARLSRSRPDQVVFDRV